MSTLSAFRLCKLGNRAMAAGNRARIWLYNPFTKTGPITKVYASVLFYSKKTPISSFITATLYKLR